MTEHRKANSTRRPIDEAMTTSYTPRGYYRDPYGQQLQSELNQSLAQRKQIGKKLGASAHWKLKNGGTY